MIGSLFSGISGINANSEAMAVIGDNIANVNTTGFKSASVSFGDMVSQSLGETGNSICGNGVELTGVNQYWASGSFEDTGNATDLAINGKGLFVVTNENDSMYFTRAGNFNFNNQGYFVNSDGFHVQGYKINDSGGLDTLSAINISGENSYKHQATTELDILLNLNSQAEDGDKYSTTITVIDSLGGNIPLTLEFTKVAGGNEWDVAASIAASAGTGATIDTASFEFDSTGKLIGTTNPKITLALTNGALTNQEITISLYDDDTSNGNLTGYPSPNMMSSHTQNGYGVGILQAVSVDKEGVVIGSYSNGQRIDLFRIALADFSNYSGLARAGNNLYTATEHSGQSSIGIIGTGRLGTITPESLEMSNVDLATEFIKMITTQRAFQANSRVITASDELLAELINLKR